MKIQTWLNDTSNMLLEAGIESARLDSSLLLENRLQKPRDWVIAHEDDVINEEQIKILHNDVVQRKNHVPLAYITGFKEFYGRDFLVNENVLIPRSESEAVIELLLRHSSLEVESRKTNVNSSLLDPPIRVECSTRHSKSEDDKRFVVLDIGTGSGILAVTAQLELPNTVVLATDISEAALAVAKQNAERLGAPVQFHQADMLDIPKSIKPNVIITNLPYVPDTLITSEEITKEPPIALFSGNDGLDHYRKFWSQVINLSTKPQVIITESLEIQHVELSKLAQIAGYKLTKTKTLIQQFTQIK